MKKPYTVCYMMMSVDGRIDCAMTEYLPGDEYYPILDSLNADAYVTGRVTAEMEFAKPGKFESKSVTPINKEGFYKAEKANGYDVIIDTKGSLLWDGIENDRPLLIVTSEQANKEYLSYLEGLNISWIATGKERVDLKRASEILATEFGIKKMAVVGGGNINAGFLAAGLLDEVIVLIGAGIDGRKGQISVFDGLPIDHQVTELHLEEVKSYESGAVLIRYSVINK